jgi:hypothetical protein
MKFLSNVMGDEKLLVGVGEVIIVWWCVCNSVCVCYQTIVIRADVDYFSFNLWLKTEIKIMRSHLWPSCCPWTGLELSFTSADGLSPLSQNETEYSNSSTVFKTYKRVSSFLEKLSIDFFFF